MLHEKMQKQVPAWSLVAVAVVVVLLFAVGAGLYNSGWSNGLTFGLLANGGTNSSLLAYQVPTLGHGMGHVGWGHGSFLGGILHFLLFLFVIRMIFKFLGIMRWKMHMAHQSGHHPMSGGQPNAGQGNWGGPPWARHPHWQQPQQPPQPQQAQSESNIPITPNQEKPKDTSWIV